MGVCFGVYWGNESEHGINKSREPGSGYIYNASNKDPSKNYRRKVTYKLFFFAILGT